MDPIELDLKRKTAGGEYLAALTDLGLRVNALFWVLSREWLEFEGGVISRLSNP